MAFQNHELEKLTSPNGYGVDTLSLLAVALQQHGTLTFDRLPSGLFPATHMGAFAQVSGYGNVWVRDNVYIAYAHYLSGDIPVALGVVRGLLSFYSRYRSRFDDIINGVTGPGDVSSRPHVRFDGNLLAEITSEHWAHAQNDALGYFLWLYTQIAGDNHLTPDEQAVSVLELFPRYFAAIRYWEDEDSGHWEETRKVSASSIGVVLAGLESLLRLARKRPELSGGCFSPASLALTSELAARGRSALATVLPHECAQLDPKKNRRYDSALLLLLFPLAVLDGPTAELVLHDSERYLSGDYGIRRYLLDSYWAPDYDMALSVEDRTRDYSNDIERRDILLGRIGDEAQWCIFDPILSAYYGQCFLATQRADDMERQLRYFHRSLSQVTPSWKCPELYYKQRGEYAPGPHLPLQWTQANLLMALQMMQASIGASTRE